MYNPRLPHTRCCRTAWLRAGGSQIGGCCLHAGPGMGKWSGEKEVQFLRDAPFAPKLAFDDLEALNTWLRLRCEELAERCHTERQYRTIADVFVDEKISQCPLNISGVSLAISAISISGTMCRLCIASPARYVMARLLLAGNCPN